MAKSLTTIYDTQCRLCEASIPVGTRALWDAQGIAHLAGECKSLQEVAQAYARETGACMFCHRKLTHPTSVSHGYGPVCAERNGLPYEAVAVHPPDALEIIPWDYAGGEGSGYRWRFLDGTPPRRDWPEVIWSSIEPTRNHCLAAAQKRLKGRQV